jgi:hypothetical protein
LYESFPVVLHTFQQLQGEKTTPCYNMAQGQSGNACDKMGSASACGRQRTEKQLQLFRVAAVPQGIVQAGGPSAAVYLPVTAENHAVRKSRPPPASETPPITAAIAHPDQPDEADREDEGHPEGDLHQGNAEFGGDDVLIGLGCDLSGGFHGWPP